MSDPTTGGTPPPPEPEKPKHSNEPKIPREYDDEIWGMYLAGDKAPAIAKALVDKGVDATRSSVNRRLKRLARERLSLEYGFSKLMDAVLKGREARIVLDRLRDNYDDVSLRLTASWEGRNKQEVSLDLSVARELRAGIREHRRLVDEGDKAEQQLEELKKAAEKAKARGEQQSSGPTPWPTGEPVPPPPGGGSTASSPPPPPPPGDVPPPAPPPGTASPAGEPAPGAAAAAASDEFDPKDHIDPKAPLATITSPANGDKLKKKPETFVGHCPPKTEVILTVGDKFVTRVRSNQHGAFRVRGDQVEGLEPGGEYKATASTVTRQGKLSRATGIVFKILPVLCLLSLAGLLGYVSLRSVKSPIPSRSGLGRPEFSVLDFAPAAGNEEEIAPDRAPMMDRERQHSVGRSERVSPELMAFRAPHDAADALGRLRARAQSGPL